MALEIAKSKSFKYVWLGVWEQNLKAIRFYEKNGFNVLDINSNADPTASMQYDTRIPI